MPAVPYACTGYRTAHGPRWIGGRWTRAATQEGSRVVVCRRALAVALAEPCAEPGHSIACLRALMMSLIADAPLRMPPAARAAPKVRLQGGGDRTSAACHTCILRWGWRICYLATADWPVPSAQNQKYILMLILLHKRYEDMRDVHVCHPVDFR